MKSHNLSTKAYSKRDTVVIEAAVNIHKGDFIL